MESNKTEVQATTTKSKFEIIEEAMLKNIGGGVYSDGSCGCSYNGNCYVCEGCTGSGSNRR